MIQIQSHPEIEAQSVLNAVAPLFDYLDAISVAVSNSYLETRERLRREQDHRQYSGTAQGEQPPRPQSKGFGPRKP